MYGCHRHTFPSLFLETWVDLSDMISPLPREKFFIEGACQLPFQMRTKLKKKRHCACETTAPPTQELPTYETFALYSSFHCASNELRVIALGPYRRLGLECTSEKRRSFCTGRLAEGASHATCAGQLGTSLVSSPP